jgi:Pvc16 N-terminal domain/IPT/TIG domain
MSNSLAIAAVTATLRNLLTQGIQLEPNLVDTTVTTMLPDRARASSDTANQVNLFLYQATPNAAWRNLDMPARVRPGETGNVPLALNLYYLVTAYGRDNDQSQPFSHELLGRAMSILHDHPVLGQDEIQAALPGNDLYTQIERIRFTLQPLGVEEIYRLWTGFQTPYRTSVSYEATVVLIDSSLATIAPLPVLTRGRPAYFNGQIDQGVVLIPSVLPPAITAILPNSAAVFGQTLTLQGSRLAGDSVSISIGSPLLAAPVVVPAASVTDTAVTLTVPSDTTFPAGLYSLGVTVTRGGMAFSSNALPLALGPTITSGLPASVAASTATATLTLGCDPPIQLNQRASLLLGGAEIVANAFTAPASSVEFTLANIPAGVYYARLRVDGADSALVADMTQTPPAFDPQKQLTVT